VAKPRKRCYETASRMISTGVFVALEASPFQVIHNLGKLAKGGLTVFDDLKHVRCPRSLDPTLVTLPSMSLIPFAPFSGDDVQVDRWQRLLRPPALRREAPKP